MKSASVELQAVLDAMMAGAPAYMADLYTISLVGGTVLRYTGYDLPLTLDGDTYQSAGPLFERGRTRTLVGIEVDTMTLTIHAGTAITVGGVPILQAVAAGTFDGATFRLARAFMLDPAGPPPGALILFEGRVAETEISRSEARLTVRSLLELLNVQLPRNLYQAGCVNTLFDDVCGLVKASHGSTTTVGAASTQLLLNCALAQAGGFFDGGTVTMLSGPNAGVTRTVKRYQTGQVELAYPLPKLPYVGDSFTAYPGCDKTQATCTAKYANLPRFRGFPHIPVPETAL